MRQHTTRLALASLVLAAAALATRPAAADDAFRHGHFREVEPGVTLQRATETSAEEAMRNVPFLPGDRVWTDAAGRAEFQFPEGTVVRVDSRSKIDYADHDEGEPERVVLRLWSGSLILRTRSRDAALFDIETPGGLVQVAVPGVVRIDVEGGETQLSVYEGEASLDTGRGPVYAAAGERTWASWGSEPAPPERFDRYAGDAFAGWDADLESRETWAANSSRYLPQELSYYAPEFDTHGTWVYEQPVGYVWQPRVVSGWAPYTNGRWAWTSYGWTWVPYESWGWAPHHYGRWGFSVSLGWYWAPGTVWGAGWVSWGVGGGYVGWCALGPWNRPVVPWPHHRYGPRKIHRGYAVPRQTVRNPGHAVPYGALRAEQAWSVVKRDDLGRRDVARRRVDPSGVGALRVAQTTAERPNRGASELTTRTAAIPRAAQRRPRAGLSSRAARGASPVPTGSTSRALSSRSGATRRSPAATSSAVGPGLGGIAAAAARARSRSGTSAASTSAGTRSGATGAPGAAARARPRSGGASGTATSPAARGTGSAPWIGSSRSRGAASARPRSSRGSREESPIGSLFQSRERAGSTSRARPRSSPGASRGGTGLGVTPSTRSRVPPGSGVRSQPRSGSGSSRLGTSPSSGSRGSVSVRPRSSPRSGVSSRPRSSRSSGVSSRTRSAPRSGVSSRPRSSPSRGVSRSPSVSRRPSGGASRSSGASRGGSARSRGRPH